MATLLKKRRYASLTIPQVTARGPQSQPTTYCGLRRQPRRLSLRSVQPLFSSVQTAQPISASISSLTVSRPVVMRRAS